MRMTTVIPAGLQDPVGEQRGASVVGCGCGRLAAELMALIKPKLAIFSVLAAAVGYTAVATEIRVAQLAVFVLAAALTGGGSLALNQWYERDRDTLMNRTRRRPLVRGTLSPGIALAWALILACGGVLLFATAINTVSAVIAGAIVVVYAGLYTPLKRRTVWATEVGAVAGALPPVLGAAAAGDATAAPAVALATIVLFWQMPHFYAICAYYRSDYRAAGFRLLPAADSVDASRTCRRTAIYTALAVMFTFMPVITGTFGAAYAIIAAPGTVLFALRAAEFLRVRTHGKTSARRLFGASIVFLTAVFLAVSLGA